MKHRAIGERFWCIGARADSSPPKVCVCFQETHSSAKCPLEFGNRPPWNFWTYRMPGLHSECCGQLNHLETKYWKLSFWQDFIQIHWHDRTILLQSCRRAYCTVGPVHDAILLKSFHIFSTITSTCAQRWIVPNFPTMSFSDTGDGLTVLGHPPKCSLQFPGHLTPARRLCMYLCNVREIFRWLKVF